MLLTTLPRLLAVHFILHSTEGNIYGQQIHAFCTSFYRQLHERITESNHTASPSSSVVLRWLREQHGGATIRCLLLLSQTSICHPRASVTVDEQCSQVVDLLQHSWQVISAGGQCRVERCFRVARGDTSGQYVALKTVALSLGLPEAGSEVLSRVIASGREVLTRGLMAGDDVLTRE